ncbi:MAG: Phosphoglycerate kinase [Acidimicrobiaceae bacterium]|nr:Phosphoglycerate kinase [Acidimicrobiaceae bacterium]
MSMRLPLLEDLPDLDGKRVLLRADFNCPIAEAPDGSIVITDDYRIQATIPTIEWLQEQGAKITICTHLGRPEGRPDPKLVLDPVRARLAELAPGVEFQENVRFYPGEEANDADFVEQLIAGQDVYVNDAFGVSHRAHASIVGPPARLPSAAGRLLAREVEVLSGLLGEPARPFVAVVGGAKIADKLGVLRALARKVDALIIGGGMSYTFLKALGHGVGASLLDETHLASCTALLSDGTELLLPSDVVALAPGSHIHRGERAPEGESTSILGREIPAEWEAVDIGPETRQRYAETIASAKTVLWNGPMGVFEDERFAAGTLAVAEAVASCSGFTVVGGGDSVAAINSYGLAEKIDHISSGGGASLELIELGDLPGLAALRGAPNFSARH